LVFCP